MKVCYTFNFIHSLHEYTYNQFMRYFKQLIELVTQSWGTAVVLFMIWFSVLFLLHVYVYWFGHLTWFHSQIKYFPIILIKEENYNKQLFIVPKLPAGGTAGSELIGWWNEQSVLWLVGVLPCDSISWAWGCSSGWLVGGVVSLSTWRNWRTVRKIIHDMFTYYQNMQWLITYLYITQWALPDN